MIVARRELVEQLEPCARARSLDVPASVVSLEDVLDTDSASADDPERLKRFLYRRWLAGKGKEHPLRYVLLVGDAGGGHPRLCNAASLDQRREGRVTRGVHSPLRGVLRPRQLEPERRQVVA
ncbi:MAG: hypothetical protein IT435_17415 [Phycisphaerales bacterium]|nr:hypothetical protein [Phycisphaerales bacterium]